MDITQHTPSVRKQQSSTPLTAQNSSPRSLNQSIANLEELLFEAESKGNTRKANALRMVLRRLRRMTGRSQLFH